MSKPNVFIGCLKFLIFEINFFLQSMDHAKRGFLLDFSALKPKVFPT